MKSKRKIKKLEFRKETIALLGADFLNKVNGGCGTATAVNNTCTCVTFTSRKAPCNE